MIDYGSILVVMLICSGVALGGVVWAFSCTKDDLPVTKKFSLIKEKSVAML